MVSGNLVNVLAELPEPGSYIAIYKVGIVLFCLGLWAAFGQWVDKDTQAVRMSRNLWNGIILGMGMLGLIGWLLMPLPGGLFFVGLGMWLLISGGACVTYVVNRNSLVPEKRRVFTRAHIKAMLVSTKKKDKRADALEKVKLTDSEGRSVSVPDDDEEVEGYTASQDLLFDALWRRVTEVDIAVAAEAARLAYRIDGVPMERKDLLDHARSAHAVRFLKRIAGLDVEDHRRPQSGKIFAELQGASTAQIEIKSSGSTMGERLQLGFVSDVNQLRMGDLGFAPQRLERFTEAVQQTEGLVICSGPRQSGVTTTLYAALRDHDAYMQNVHTIERQPLYELENVTQHRYDDAASAVSYARRLQSILRREPDVVLVDDCSMEDTAKLSAKAAANGRKIYLQVEAKDSFEALNKVMQLCKDPSELAASLLAVTSQRLIRTLCTSCREAYKPDPKLLKKINLPADKIEQFYRTPTEPLVDKKGRPIICPECQGTGYVGRTGVFELLAVDDEIRKLVKAKADISAIKAQARKERMLYLQEEGLLKVMEGSTSMKEIIRGLRDNDSG